MAGRARFEAVISVPAIGKRWGEFGKRIASRREPVLLLEKK